MEEDNATDPNAAPQNDVIQASGNNDPVSSPTNSDPVPNEILEERKSMAPVIGSIIVIAVIVIGGLYLYGEQVVKRQQAQMTPEEILAETDPQLEALASQGSSDEVADIEGDLDNTDFSDLDAELDNLDLEFGS